MNQITVEDFDNAVKRGWSRTTCVAAQAIKRITGEFPNQIWDNISARIVWGRVSHVVIDKTVAIFDNHFREPGDENKPELQALRASLPINL